MEDINPTPGEFSKHKSALSGPLGALDPTPRRFPEHKPALSGPLGALDPTPRRFPDSHSAESAPLKEPDPMPDLRANPEIARPAQRRAAHALLKNPRSLGSAKWKNAHDSIHLSPLPALNELAPREPAHEKRMSSPETITGPIPQSVAPRPGKEGQQKQGTRKPWRSLYPFVSQPRQTTLSLRTRLKKQPLARRWPWLLLIIGLLLSGMVGGCAYGVYFFETNVVRPLGQFFHPLSGDRYNALDGRTWNLLLLGSDNDAKFTYPDLLTQVMMVVHIDPLNNTISMVSIPRDSWVHVPGTTGMHKIDQAFYLGSAPHNSFDNGVRLARATVEQDYGIPIDRYAWIGLKGFASLINTLGGIDIDLTHPILDDNYPDDISPHAHSSYAVKRLYLAPGPQHLSGDKALEYVRSRHADLVGDIGRTQRQQEILEALKQKLNLPTIFNHLHELFKDLTGKVYTDLSQGEILAFANFGRDLPPTAIQRLTLGPGRDPQNYGTFSQVKDPGLGETQDVVLPNCAAIQPAINAIFSLGDAQSCQVNGP